MKTFRQIVDICCWALLLFAFCYFAAAVIIAAPRIAEVAR